MSQTSKSPKANGGVSSLLADETLRKAWGYGHLIILATSTVYLLSTLVFLTNLFIIKLIYRISIISIVLTYSLSIYKKYKNIASPSFYYLVSTENFQYLLLSLIWLFTRQSSLKIFPYFVYSLLHVNYSKAKSLSIISKYENNLLQLISYVEILLIFKLLFNTLLLRGTAGYVLVIYLSFYRLRIDLSPQTRQTNHLIGQKIDILVNNSKTPVQVKKLYSNFLDYKEEKKRFDPLRDLANNSKEVQKVEKKIETVKDEKDVLNTNGVVKESN